MPHQPIQFWFEFASSYSYLSVARIQELSKKLKFDFLWKPFLLGPIFSEQGWSDSPFNLYPTKGKYMWRDLARQCQKYRIPFTKPSQFPRNGLLAARVACSLRDNPNQRQFIQEIFRYNFEKDIDIANTMVIQKILKKLHLDPELILNQALSSENKEYLRNQTEQAKSLGIFGAPTFIVGKEIFWGDDRLEDAVRWSQCLE